MAEGSSHWNNTQGRKGKEVVEHYRDTQIQETQNDIREALNIWRSILGSNGGVGMNLNVTLNGKT